MNNYSKKRDKSISILGFIDYKEYLNSKLWDIIRRGVLKRDYCKCRCTVCVNKDCPKQVHHLNYNLPTMLGLTTNNLLTVCSDCHHYLEFSKTGKKLSSRSVSQRSKKLLVLPPSDEFITPAQILPAVIREYPKYVRMLEEQIRLLPSTTQDILLPKLEVKCQPKKIINEDQNQNIPGKNGLMGKNMS